MIRPTPAATRAGAARPGSCCCRGSRSGPGRRRRAAPPPARRRCRRRGRALLGHPAHDRRRQERLAGVVDVVAPRTRRGTPAPEPGSRPRRPRRSASGRGTTRSTKPWLNRNSARWKPGGNSGRDGPGRTRAPAKPMSALGSAMFTSPTAANDANTPPVVGSDRIERNGTPARRRSRAASVLASCIRASVPSCIRAPPEALTTMSGIRASRACWPPG